MDLQYFLKKIPHLSQICALSRKDKVGVWLVGGFLRDAYLRKNKEFLDFDFCVERSTHKFAKKFSKITSSKLIILDEQQQSYRIILKRKGKIFTYDFAQMRAPTFKMDLRLRDFTINTLSLNLSKKPLKVVDYFGAESDLRKKIIRILSEEVLLHDPLRILRGFSLMANYGFRIEKITQMAMQKYKGLIKNVSGERINEELFKIFASPCSFKAIKEMSQLRIIDEILPGIDKGRNLYQGPYHHLDVWQHSLETLRKFELLYQRRLIKDKDVFAYLNEPLAQGRLRMQVLKFACLLHDIGKPYAREEKDKKTIFHTHEKIGRDLASNIADNLRLSFREKEVLKKLIYWHLRPGYLADERAPSKRAVYRFFRDAQEEGAAVILLSLSDWRATRGPLTNQKRRRRHEQVMLKLIKHYFQKQKIVPLPKIVDGNEIMKRFNLSPSPLIGGILKKIHEEQALGEVSTKAQAYKVARRVISKPRPFHGRDKIMNSKLALELIGGKPRPLWGRDKFSDKGRGKDED